MLLAVAVAVAVAVLFRFFQCHVHRQRRSPGGTTRVRNLSKRQYKYKDNGVKPIRIKSWLRYPTCRKCKDRETCLLQNPSTVHHSSNRSDTKAGEALPFPRTNLSRTPTFMGTSYLYLVWDKL